MQQPNVSLNTTNSLLKDSDILLFVTDKKGVITSNNELFSEIAGHVLQSQNGQLQNILKPSDMPEFLSKFMCNTLESGFPFGGYLRNKNKTGDAIWVFSLIFPLKNCNFGISVKANHLMVDEIASLYQKMIAAERNSTLKSQETLNAWLVSVGYTDYCSWMANALELEMHRHPFFASIMIENETILDLQIKGPQSLQAISTQAIRQMWDSYALFQRNFKNCILRLRDCIKHMRRFQALMISFATLDNSVPLLFKPYTRESTTLSIYRMHADFFLQSSLRLQFWYNALILQSKLIDDIIIDSMKKLEYGQDSKIDQMFNTINLIHVLTENIALIPNKLESEYERVFQKSKEYLELIAIENKPELLSQASQTDKKFLLEEIREANQDLINIYSRLCDDFELDVNEFHQVVRSAFHIMLGPKRASA